MSWVRFPGSGHARHMIGSYGFLLGVQELGCRYRMTGQVLVHGVPHKPQGDLKPEVLSLHGALLPEIAAACNASRTKNAFL